MLLDNEFEKWAIENKIYDQAAFLYSMENISDPDFKDVKNKVLKMKNTLKPFIADTSSVQKFEDSLLHYCHGQFFVDLEIVYSCVYELRNEKPTLEYLQDVSEDLLRIYNEDPEIFTKAFYVLNNKHNYSEYTGRLKNREQEIRPMVTEYIPVDQIVIPEVPHGGN